MATPAETDEGGSRPRTSGGGGGGNAFTRKLGPLPLWAWMGIGLAVALVVAMWRSNKAKKTSDTSQNEAASSDSTDTADQTPPFIIQNYTSYPQTGPAATPPSASTPATPTTPSTPAKPTTPTLPTKPSKPTRPSTTAKPVAYKVKPGDTLTSIAKKYGTTVDKIWAYNTGTGPGTANRPASTIATLKKRGKNLLYSNETIYIPPK